MLVSSLARRPSTFNPPTWDRMARTATSRPGHPSPIIRTFGWHEWFTLDMSSNKAVVGPFKPDEKQCKAWQSSIKKNRLNNNKLNIFFALKAKQKSTWPLNRKEFDMRMTSCDQRQIPTPSSAGSSLSLSPKSVRPPKPLPRRSRGWGLRGRQKTTLLWRFGEREKHLPKNGGFQGLGFLMFFGPIAHSQICGSHLETYFWRVSNSKTEQWVDFLLKQRCTLTWTWKKSSDSFSSIICRSQSLLFPQYSLVIMLTFSSCKYYASCSSCQSP